MNAINRHVDAAACFDMIILDHDPVIKAIAIIVTTPQPDSFLFEESHSGSGLAGVEDLDRQSFNFLEEQSRERRNSAHPLHDIQCQSFTNQQCPGRAGNMKSNVTWLDLAPILDEDFKISGRGNFFKYPGGNSDAR